MMFGFCCCATAGPMAMVARAKNAIEQSHSLPATVIVDFPPGVCPVKQVETMRWHTSIKRRLHRHGMPKYGQGADGNSDRSIRHKAAGYVRGGGVLFDDRYAK